MAEEKTETILLTLTDMANGGDALGRDDNNRVVFVPYTIPGERVRVEIQEDKGRFAHGRLLEVLEPAPERVEPRCPHFGVCGGCVLQHADEATYRSFKQAQITEALSRQGLEPPAWADPFYGAPGQRRRAALAAVATTQGVLLGFHERASHRITDISVCPLLLPELEALLAPLRAVLGSILKPGDRLSVRATASDSGVDVLISGGAALDLSAREALVEFAAQADLARLSWEEGQGAGPEPVLIRREPVIAFDGIEVPLPPEAFLQASRESEEALRGYVNSAIGKAKPVADLFAGLGTFALPLAKTRPVRAVEGEAASLAALDKSAQRTPGLKPVEAQQRDLFESPLSVQELDVFEAVIFDPPRAGAKAQCEELAMSHVPLIVAVSCDAPTFARDARILSDGGYRLEEIKLVDQFLWSAPVELAAIFRR
ncbi:MAG: TRAM domain-containing protein [Alphaproteobacteria bacterium]|nr:TRAM domain-containing protein [Alphaproteobacteria bacterium]